MPRRVRQHRPRRPCRGHRIEVMVQRPRKTSAVPAVRREPRRMRLRPAPIRRRDRPRAIRKFDLHPQPPRPHPRRYHPHRHPVPLRVRHRPHLHRLPVKFKPAHNLPPPQIQPLADARQIIRPRRRPVRVPQHQPDLPQMQPVRILPQPFHLCRLLIPGRIHIRDRPAIEIGKSFAGEFLQAPTLRIRRRVPAPVRQRGQRRRCQKSLRKSLQPRRIRRERKLPVPHRQRIARVKISQPHRMPPHQRRPVDRPRHHPRRRRNQQPRHHRHPSYRPADLIHNY